MPMKYITHSEKETIELGAQLGKQIENPVVVALFGELGSGKTVFVRGLARGLDVREKVQSPSFVIMRIYQGRLPVYHLDLYRVFSPEEIYGYEEYLYGDGVCVIEWAERIRELLPSERIEVRLKIRGEKEREIEIEWVK